MKTRRNRLEIERHKRRQRKIEEKELMPAFYNPYSSYKIAENFCFVDDNGDPKMSLDCFFKWNRITSAVNHENYISFVITPYRAEALLCPEYVVERFKSFGSQQHYQLALKLEAVLKANDYDAEEQEYFPKPHQLVKEYDSPNWVIFHGRFNNGMPCRNTLDVSHAFCQQFGMTPEQMMVAAVKYGDLPIRFQKQANAAYVAICSKFADMLLAYRALSRQKNVQQISSVAKMTRRSERVAYTTSSNSTGTATYQISFPSPMNIVLTVDDVQDRFMMSNEWRCLVSEQIDMSDYLALKTIMGWEQGKMKKPGSRTCKYRVKEGSETNSQ